MSQADPQTELPVVPASPCCRLRSKGMYVYTSGEGGESHDDYDSSAYWCLKTMKGFGPDDEVVDRPGCSNSARTCYEPT
jgi:hypothetical protein